jgi:hypothetical protein
LTGLKITKNIFKANFRSKFIDLQKITTTPNEFHYNVIRFYRLVYVWCLMPFSTIFQLYRGGNQSTRRKPENLYKLYQKLKNITH